jgi:seryl-tRNA synthetase
MSKPEALQLADALVADRWHPRYREHAAAELRRLHALNGELLEALKALLALSESVGDPPNGTIEIEAKARAAIAKATSPGGAL